MGRPASADLTLMVVPDFQYCGARYQTWLPLGQDHTPGCGGSVVTNSRFCTAARASAGTGGSNSITMGMATPTVSPLLRYSAVPASLPGLPIVLKVVFRVIVSRPLALWPVTATVY